MTEQPSLFDERSPLSHKGETTSQMAANAVRETARTIRANVLAFVRDHPEGVIGSQVAEALSGDPWVIRPRLTELKCMNEIVKLDDTRIGASGRRERVWVAS